MSSLPAGQLSPLLSNLRFVRFLAGKSLQMTGQNALVYGLFILLVREQASSLATSAFILASVIPSIVLSLPGGVVADALPAKAVILVTLLMRAATVALFLSFQAGTVSILLLSGLVWSIYQFYAPGENAALPAVAPASQMASATALLHGLSLLAQMAGAGLLAPIALKLFDSDGLIWLVLLLFAAAFVCFAAVPNLTPGSRPTARSGSRSPGAMLAGSRIIRAEALLTRVTVIRVMVDTASMMLVVSLPVVVRELLDTAPENTVYIVSPGALGIAVGLPLSSLLTRISVRGVLWTGFALLIAVMLGLVFLPELATVLDARTFLPLSWFQSTFGVSRDIATVALLLPFGGLAVTFVQVAARTAVYEVAPPHALAQVFATQAAFGSLVALVPTLVTGVLLDVFEVRTVLALIESALIGSLLLMLLPVRQRTRRRRPFE